MTRPYTIVRSRRKTLAIHITKDAAVEARAPMRMPEDTIRRFIDKKEAWIEEHIARREQQNTAKSAFSLHYGDRIPFCGKPFPIRAKAGRMAGFDSEGFWTPPDLR